MDDNNTNNSPGFGKSIASWIVYLILLMILIILLNVIGVLLDINSGGSKLIILMVSLFVAKEIGKVFDKRVLKIVKEEQQEQKDQE